MIKFAKYIVACNGIDVEKRNEDDHYLTLENDKEKANKNIRIELLDFVNSVYTLDDRKKDLLEIAGYIFAADRKASRGAVSTLDYHRWSRDFEIHIKVRDIRFWNQPTVKHMLDEALSFMTGDHKYNFNFYQAEPDFPTSIFDNEKFTIEPKKGLSVVLFSGGLDSLSGVIELLEETDDELCLVSHQSGNPSVANTQKNLFDEIKKLYPDRCSHYKFNCGLCRGPSVDETQRTRSFLFNSIAFVLATTFGKNENILFENGITSFNFAETQDMMNSRASRTTHPKTLRLLEKLFTEINEKEYNVKNRYYDKTKTDVVDVLKKYDKLELIDISVSCSHTRNHRPHYTHCGVCSQCIDRRFATHAAEVEEHDESGLYDFDFVIQDLEEDDTIKALNDYLRIAKKFSEKSLTGFHDEFIDELSDIEEYIGGDTEAERITRIYNVCLRHGEQIEGAVERMRQKHDRAFSKFRQNSLFSLMLGIRNSKSEIELLRLNSDGERKKEIPKRKIKTITAKVYENILNKGEIDIKTEETKKNPNISRIVIPELEKKYILKPSEKRTIADYFRQKRIEAKRDKGKIEVKTNKF